jgi:flagellar biogenesis protein FliO
MEQPSQLMGTIQILLLVFASLVAVVGLISLICYAWTKAVRTIERNNEKAQIIHNADVEILKEEQSLRTIKTKQSLNCLQLTDGSVIEGEPVLEEAKDHIWRS